MAVYGLYEDIDVGSLRQAINTLKSSAERKKTELVSFRQSAEKDWTASAKETFLTAVDNIINSSFAALDSQLMSLNSLADYVEMYRENSDAAKKNKQLIADLNVQLNNATGEVAKSAIISNINDIQNVINSNESQMEICQNIIEGAGL